MTNRIRLSRPAQQDIAAAQEWYADQPVPNLDLRFQRELEDIFEQIESIPAGYPAIYKDIRRANLHRFPYAVFYHLRAETPYVLAVVHHARHPRTWKRRR